MTRHLEQDHPLLMFPGRHNYGWPLPVARRFYGRLLSAAIDSEVQLQPVAIRYLREGQLDTLAPFIGDDDLLSHLMRLFANGPGGMWRFICSSRLFAKAASKSAALAFEAQQAVQKALFGVLYGQNAGSRQCVPQLLPDPIFDSTENPMGASLSPR